MDRKIKYEIILTICTGLLVLGFILKINNFSIIAAVIGVLSLLSKRIAQFISWFWNKLSDVLSAISSRVILFIVYFIILVPLALLSRVFGKSNLHLKRKENIKSCFVDMNHQYVAEDMEDMW
jgi:membrane-anchored glycerophosphoryl diester phosphodiesterase (GDPDase)